MSRARRYGSAPDIAAYDAAHEWAQKRTAEKLDRLALRRAAELRRARRGLPPKRERRCMSPRDAFLLMRQRREDLTRKRNGEVSRGFVWNPALAEWADDAYRAIEEKAKDRELRHCRTRHFNAAKLERAAAWAREHGIPDPEQFEAMASKLRRARTAGWYGWNLDAGTPVMRFCDRSGLALVDPSEAIERTATLCERLLPLLRAHVRAGYRLYYAVFSEPNVKAGELAFGMRSLFERFRRVVLSGAVSEIVGAFAVLEAPLSRDMQSWNTHLNVLLVVDPDECMPLPPEKCRQIELDLATPHGAPARELVHDPAPRGALSYVKLHWLWGSHQVEVQPIKGYTREEIAQSVLEVIKYSTKWVGKKQLDGMDYDSGTAAAVGGEGIPGDSDTGRSAGPVDPVLRRAPFDLSGERATARTRRAQAPAFIDWPEARVVEYIRAHQGFRRVRGWGRLYRIAKRELPPDPEKLGRIVWLGRIAISPHAVQVFAARLRYVGSIHGDKSGGDFSGATGRGLHAQARAGPATGAAMP